MTKYEDAIRIANILNYKKIKEGLNGGAAPDSADYENDEDYQNALEEYRKENNITPQNGNLPTNANDTKKESKTTEPEDPNKVANINVLKTYFNAGVKAIKQAQTAEKAADKKSQGWGSRVGAPLKTAIQNGVKNLGTSIINGITGSAAIPANAITSTASALSGKTEAQILASTLAYTDSLKPMKESDVTISDKEKAYGEKLFNWYSKLKDDQQAKSIENLDADQLSTLTKYIAANNPNSIITKDVTAALKALGGSTADNIEKPTGETPSPNNKDATNGSSTSSQNGTGETKTDPNAAQTGGSSAVPDQTKVAEANKIIYGYQPAFDSIKLSLTRGQIDVASLMTAIKNYVGIK